MTLAIIVGVGIGIAGAVGMGEARGSGGCDSSVVWRTQRDGTQVCPRTHSFIAGTSWVDPRWTGWGSSVARARGNNLDYPPPAGSDGKSPMTLRLDRPLHCPDGVTIYSWVTGAVHYRGPVPAGFHRVYRFHYRVYCSGATGSGGGG
jgi:hypothetical protein